MCRTVATSSPTVSNVERPADDAGGNVAFVPGVTFVTTNFSNFAESRALEKMKALGSSCSFSSRLHGMSSFTGRSHATLVYPPTMTLWGSYLQ